MERFKDIEFVKQSIGHQKLDTTSAYVNKLSNQERQERISRLSQVENGYVLVTNIK